MGPKGDKGDTGLQGLQGLRGDRGPQGIQGERGPVGFNASNNLVERVVALEQQGATFLQLQQQQQQQTNGSLLTGFAPSPGVTVIGNSTFVMGDSVFLGSPTTVTVTEVVDDWVPNSVTVNVGDIITWVWSTNTSMVEVDPTSTNTTVVNGATSGAYKQASEWSQQMLVSGVRTFRNERSRSLMTVQTVGFGITHQSLFARSQLLDTLYADVVIQDPLSLNMWTAALEFAKYLVGSLTIQSSAITREQLNALVSGLQRVSGSKDI